MAETPVSTKRIALIHNSSLPAPPLGILSTILASECQRCYCRRDGLTIHILDIADYDVPSSLTSSPSSDKLPTSAATPVKKPLSEWQSEISQSSGFILLFPYHVWSNCNAIKNALSETVFPREKYFRTIASKPVLFAGFGKEDIWHPNKPGTGDGWTQRTWARKSFPMMRDWAVERGMKPMPPQHFGPGPDNEFWPEFNCFDDYWRTWESTGVVVIGGQQSEAWESAGHNRCQEGMRRMAETLRA